MKYRAVIFDMDGTILDTADDLTAAVNHAMKVCGHRHDFIRRDAEQMFGSGAHTALQRALAMEAGVTDPAALLRIGTSAPIPAPVIDEAEVCRIEEVFRPYYLEHSMERTGPFPGILELLWALRRQGRKTAVVSNKPDPAVRKLAAECFEGLFDAALGERPDIRKKPAPDMTAATLRLLGISSGEAVYLGDSEIDVQTAENAGLDCICVSWGFRSRAFLESLHPLAVVDTPDQILSLL